MSLNTILATAPLTTQNYILKATGTTIGNSLIYDNGTNVGIGNQGTTYKLDVSGTGRFTSSLDLTGGVSLAPQLNIFSNNQSTNNITLSQGFATTTDNIAYLYNRANADFIFGTNNNERMRISSTGIITFAGSGNGIPLIIQDISAAITSQTAGYIGMSTSAFSGNNGDLVLYPRTSAASNILLMGGYVLIGATTSAGAGTNRLQVTGTTSSQLLVSNTTSSGHIALYSTGVDAYITKNTASGTMYFGLAPQNGSTFTNQLSIASSGLVSIPSSVEIGNGYLSTSAGSGTTYSSRLSTEYTYPYIDTFLDSIAGASYQSRLRFRLNTAGGAMADKLILWYDGTITFSGLAGSGTRTVTVLSSGNLSTSSDSKLKQEDKEYAIGGLKELLQITPRAYKWLDDIEKRGEEAATELGFFADEVAPIIPSAAPKGNDDMYGFNDRALMAVMVKSIQELTERLNKLENK